MPTTAVHDACVLIVGGDDRDVTDLIHHLLAEADYQVVLAASVGEAAALTEPRAIDLMLLVLTSAAGRDDEAIAALRAWAAAPYVPLLVLLRRVGMADRLRALVAGADGYLIMPFDVQELITQVRTLLRLRQSIARASR